MTVRIEASGEQILFDSLQVMEGGFGFSPDESAGEPSPVPLLLTPNVAYEVELRASVRIVAFGWTSLQDDADSFVSMTVDPVFRFDQATFDEMMGDDTVTLADFYSFEFSPGVSNGVPEPTTAAFAMLGFLGLIGAVRRRRR